MTDLSLDRIGRYEIIRTLGEGAMGRVLLARDPSLDRLVAIKTIRIAGLAEAKVKAYLGRFQNEARAAARLKHPNVVQVYDVEEDPDAGPYLVFEYVQGKPLGDLLQPGGIRKIDETIRIIRGIAAALDAAHAEGIFHRDVKPDNVLIAEDGTVKLADFGVARIPEAELTAAGQFLGTPSYAAPEALARGVCTAQTDLFSLAAVAYALLTGERPFLGDGIAEVSHRVIHEDPRSPLSLRPDLPDAVSDALLKALSKDPAERFASCGEFAAVLEDAVFGRRTTEPVRGEPSKRLQVVFLTIALGLVASGWVALTYTIGRGAGSDGSDGEADASAEDTDEERVVAPVLQPVVPPERDERRPGRGYERRMDAGSEEAAEAGPEPTDAAAAGRVEPDASAKDREERIKDLIDEARRLRTEGDVEGARNRLEEVLRWAPSHPEARGMLESLPPPSAPEPEPEPAPEPATSAPPVE